MENTGKLFLLFGLHRSGSSATAGIVHFLGADMGQNEGLFENLDFVFINDEILWSNEASWDNPPNHEMVKTPYLEERMRDFLATNAKPIWGLKDPRLLLTFDIWEPYLQTIGNVTYIFIHRPFISSVKSLAFRDQLSLTKSIEILTPYHQNFHRYRNQLKVQGIDIIDVHYDQLIMNVKPFVEELNRRLGVSPEHNLDVANEWILKELRRF